MSDPQADTDFPAGILLRFLIRDPSAGYCLIEALVARGGGPLPNRHLADDEAFYVLDNTFEFGIGGETRVAMVGDFVKIPRGEVHTFRNTGQAPARTLIINAPGTAHVGFFSQAGEPVPPGTRDLPPRPGSRTSPACSSSGSGTGSSSCCRVTDARRERDDREPHRIRN
jgi:mannose-6-phosphate isomerase-like protein (cupin superfamily)